MKTRGEIKLRAANSCVMSMATSNKYYTPAQFNSEGLHGCQIEWNENFGTVKKLVSTIKGWRGTNEHTTHIQVCE